MREIAFLHWSFQPIGSLVTGYSQAMAEALGKITPRAKEIVNLETHNAEGEPTASFLISSVKGVFRTAAAWLIERVAQEENAKQYVTCDYGLAIPEKQRPLSPSAGTGLCPVCRVFGGAGCLSENGMTPAQRQQSRVRFIFVDGNDTDREKIGDDVAYGKTVDSKQYYFSWENKHYSKPLVIQQLHLEHDTLLEARVDPADDFALALLWLAGDLVSSGFFRFGRFTSRGYGVVRLRPQAYQKHNLDVLLSGKDPVPNTNSVEKNRSGREIAEMMLGQNPYEIMTASVRSWIKDR